MATPSLGDIARALIWLALVVLLGATAFLVGSLAWRGLWVESCDASETSAIVRA